MLEQEYVWEALYCDCIYESSFATISVHKTEKGAKKSIKEHEANVKKEHAEMYSVAKGYDKHPLEGFKYNDFKEWDINKIKLEN